MADREQFDHIYNNLVNGNKGDLYECMKGLDGLERADLLDYIGIELNMPETALTVAKLYFQFAHNRGDS